MLRTFLRRAPLRPLSAVRYRVKAYHKYSTGSSIHDGDPELLETEKHRNLEKKQHLTSTPHEEGAPGWNEYLASASEAHVKADKYGETGPPSPELVAKTLNQLDKRYGARTEQVMSSADSSEEATYEKDEVEGPLKSSTTGQTTDEYEVKEVITRDRKKTVTRSEEEVKADRNEI